MSTSLSILLVAYLLGSKVKIASSDLLLGMITVLCKVGNTLRSLEIICFTTIGMSNVDLAIKGLYWIIPGKPGLNLIIWGTKVRFPRQTW